MPLENRSGVSLPNISDLLHQLEKCQYFTRLDLASGFHQLEIDLKDIQKTAFIDKNGHFEFVRMTFGLKNALSTFQRLNLRIQNERSFVYDIIVYSPTIHEQFSPFRNEIAYLGHSSLKWCKTESFKSICYVELPLTKKQIDIKSFLFLVGYYRRFISKYSSH